MTLAKVKQAGIHGITPFPYSVNVAGNFSRVRVQGGTGGKSGMAHAAQSAVQSARNDFAFLEL